MLETPKFETPEDEIRFLEGRLKERREALGAQKESAEEKDALRDVLREHIEKVTPGISSGGASQDPLAGMDDHKAQIEELVRIAFSRGVTEAVRIARSLKNPHLLDEFHDVLADRFYEKLVASGAVKRSRP